MNPSDGKVRAIGELSDKLSNTVAARFEPLAWVSAWKGASTAGQTLPPDCRAMRLRPYFASLIMVRCG